MENLTPDEKSYFATDLFVIFLVLSLLAAMITILVLAVNKYSSKVSKSIGAGGSLTSDIFCNHQLLDEQTRDRNSDQGDLNPYTPSCPSEPMPQAPPPPYTPVDNLRTPPHPPPSYSLLMPTRST